MSEPFDPAPAASLLAAHWRNGTQLTELPPEIRPRTLHEGYDVQDRLILEMGEEVSGWKLGVGSPLAMRKGGLDRPLVGRILASRCYRSGDTVRLPNQAPVTVEFEIAFILGRDIQPDSPPVSPMDAVSTTHPAFELVLSRFVDRRAVGWPSFVGDSVGFEASVIGDAIDAADIDEVIRTVTVTANGKEMARGLSGDDLTDPVKSLDYLIAHARERGLTLKRGEIVSTGAIAKPFDLAGARAEIVARFLGSELRLQTQLR
jgi:2-keto-4-pentenoate hydratase